MSSWIRRNSRLLQQTASITHRGNGLAAARYFRYAPLVLALAMAGCGGGTSSTTKPASVQSPTPAGPFNAYVGTSPSDVTVSVYSSAAYSSPYVYSGSGLWSASFDHTSSLFNALDVSNKNPGYNANSNVAPNDSNVIGVGGTFSATGGFLNLTQTSNLAPGSSSVPAGFALEVPGRVAVLRQGDFTIPIAAMVPSGCPSINASTKFNFVVLPRTSGQSYSPVIWDPTADAAFGSVSITNSGATWHLTSFQQSILAGTAAPNNGTALPVGTCAPTAAGTAVYVPSDATLPLPKTVAVGPSGFYVADLGVDSDGNGYPGEFGVIQPAAALNTSDVLKQKYLGFIFESGGDALPIPESQLAGFSASSPAGQLVGGSFLNPVTLVEDPTQPAVANLSIDLGTQDAANPGVYPNATITSTTNTAGTIYQAVAVVGNPEGKYAIFIIAYDSDNLVPLGIYLFQQ